MIVLLPIFLMDFHNFCWNCQQKNRVLTGVRTGDLLEIDIRTYQHGGFKCTKCEKDLNMFTFYCDNLSRRVPSSVLDYSNLIYDGIDMSISEICFPKR